MTPAVLVWSISVSSSACNAGLSGAPLGSIRVVLAAGTSWPPNHCSIMRKRSARWASLQNSTCNSDWSRCGGCTSATLADGGGGAAATFSAGA